MSIDLHNETSGSWHCSNRFWVSVLYAAEDQGWEPAGTVLYIYPHNEPDFINYPMGMDPIVAKNTRLIDQDWKGYYGLNDGQIITPSDATNLAAALARSVLAGVWQDDSNFIIDLIGVLEGGEIMIQ